MSHNYPEINYRDISSGNVSIASGEGEKPSNILQEKYWDIKSFPCLLLDGKNYLHFNCKVKLSDQQYFVQLIMNKDLRFANSPPFIFALTAFIEIKQIESKK